MIGGDTNLKLTGSGGNFRGGPAMPAEYRSGDDDVMSRELECPSTPSAPAPLASPLGLFLSGPVRAQLRIY